MKCIRKQCGREFRSNFRNKVCNDCKATEGKQGYTKTLYEKRCSRALKELHRHSTLSNILSFNFNVEPLKAGCVGEVTNGDWYKFRFSIGKCTRRAQIIFTWSKNRIKVKGRCMRLHRESRRSTVGPGANSSRADRLTFDQYAYATPDGSCDCKICLGMYDLQKYFDCWYIEYDRQLEEALNCS
jgi:hypothetical protein